MIYDAGKYDVAVIGAGHAGIEAALAAARLGCHTAVFTINMDAVGNCPCNPSIGGTAKGHLVREIDALGGEMGKTADACTLQSRMLNLGKGAGRPLAARADRPQPVRRVMKHKLELCPNLEMKQAEVVDLQRAAEGWVLTTRLGAQYACRAVVLATGTFLGGAHFCRRRLLCGRAGRHVPGDRACGRAEKARHRAAALQDRNAGARFALLHRLFRARGAERRRAGHAVFV